MIGFQVERWIKTSFAARSKAADTVLDSQANVLYIKSNRENSKRVRGLCGMLRAL